MLASELVTRSLIQDSVELAKRIDGVALRSGRGLPSGTRWIASSDEDKSRATAIGVEHAIRLSRFRALVHLQQDGRHMVGTVGFDFEGPALPGVLDEIELDNPYTFVLLTESKVIPNKPSIEVYDAWAVESSSDFGYEGHDPPTIYGLFPTMRLFAAPQGLDYATVWPAFFGICVSECAERDSWIDPQLGASLLGLVSDPLERFPYEALCRSVFDLDPQGLFLALYRCLEATYAYKACTDLQVHLKSNMPWYELAEALGTTLSWYPRQGQALGELLAGVSREALVEVCHALLKQPPEAPAEGAAKVIYDLRNCIVHYGPKMEAVDVSLYDWNRVCVAMAGVVSEVHRIAFAEASARVA